MSTRQSAIQAGERHYFTGFPCKRGHIVNRSVSTGDCVDCNNIRTRIWQIKHREKVATKTRRWRQANKKKVVLIGARWCRANKNKINAKVAKRRAQKLRATPLWLTKKHWDEIQKIYDLATERSLTVDHIVPLKNERVCGLHVPWNLQLLTREENSKKGNRL